MPTLKPFWTLCAILFAAFILPQTSNAVEVKGVDMHGALSLTSAYSGEYNYLGDTKNSLDLNVIEGIFNAQYRFDSGLRVAAQVYAFQLSDYSSVELDYANVAYSFTDWFSVSIGRNKLPFGLYQEIQDIDVVHPFAFLPLSNYRKDLRAYFASYDGLGISGTISLKNAGSFDYKAYVGWRQEVDTDAPGVQGYATFSKFDTFKPDLVYGGWLFYNTPIQGLRFGVSSLVVPKLKTGGTIRPKKELRYQPIDQRYSGDQADQAFRDSFTALGLSQQMVDFLYGPDYSYWDSNIAGRRVEAESQFISTRISAEYIKDPFTFALEYHRTAIDVKEVGAPATDTVEDGFLALATWKATPKLELGGYLDFHWNDESNRSGKKFTTLPRHAAYTQDYALSASYKIKDWWTIKAEYHLVNGTGLISNFSHENSDPSDWKRRWNYFVLKTTFSF